jgi:hypothetical protein
MCNCSLGLIISSWEETLGVKLDGDVVESVLGGDDICRFGSSQKHGISRDTVRFCHTGSILKF